MVARLNLRPGLVTQGQRIENANIQGSATMDSQIQHDTIRQPREYSASKQGNRKGTRLLTILTGWIPLPLGTHTRNALYRTIFCRLGQDVNIQPGVSFTDGGCVELGDRVRISSGSTLDAQGESRIFLDDRVFLDQDVRISCGGKGQAKLEKDVSLDRGVDIKVHGQGRTTIGQDTYIGPYTCLSGYGDITIGKDCLIASHASLYAHNYSFEDADKLIRLQGYSHKGIQIEDNCWLGSGVRIMDGVTIGTGSIIGAGAVVTKDIPPNSIAVGTPAKVIKSRTE